MARDATADGRLRAAAPFVRLRHSVHSRWCGDVLRASSANVHGQSSVIRRNANEEPVPFLRGGDAEPQATAPAAAPQISKMEALKIAAKEKYAKAKLYLAEKAQKAAEASKAAYEKAKAEYAAAQTPEGKAKLKAKYDATKLATMEKLAKAKAVIAEKSQKLAVAAKAEYEKLKAAASKTAAPAEKK
jgi:hypothetical protein